MVLPKRIIATPFSSRNLRVLERTNLKIKDLVGKAGIAKKQIALRNLKDKIESKGLPSRRPGAIE